MKRYRRSALMEPLRRFCRAADLLILLIALRRRGRLPGFSRLRKVSYIEMGPGPMRLGRLKRALFWQVRFLDISDFGIPDPDLTLTDLEQCADVQMLIRHLREESAPGGLLVFADHCLEHISREVLTTLLRSIVGRGSAACFRVPNILSPIGHRNYAGDPTHRTSFDPQFREELKSIGFCVFPWIRWYRSLQLLRILLGGNDVAVQAEEVVLSAAPGDM